MTITLAMLLQMAWRSVTNPRECAEEVLAMGIPREALWPVLILMVVLSSILSQFANALLASASGIVLEGLFANPLITGAIQLVVLVVMVFAIYLIGRAFGGSGSFDETLLLVGWLQFIMVCLQLLQAAAVLVLPPLAALLNVAGLILFLWLLTNFVAVLHGFKSLGHVFLLILGSMFVIAFVLSLALAIFGVTVPGEV